MKNIYEDFIYMKVLYMKNIYEDFIYMKDNYQKISESLTKQKRKFLNIFFASHEYFK